MNRSITLAAIIVLVAVLAGGGGFWLARRSHSDPMPDAAAGESERRVLYWYDPMHPDQHFDKPGKSPFMDMELVPKYADEAQGGAAVRIDPSVAQNLGVRLSTVERATVSQPIEAVGNIVFNQRNVAILQARSEGFVARVYERAPGDVVTRGTPLVDLVSPEWTAAQTEFLALLSSDDRDLIAAARQRMLLLGMPPEFIEQVERERKTQTSITVRAPIAGAIETMDVRQSMTIAKGATLAKINGIETVWLEAAVPETQGGLAALGESVEARLSAYPMDVFKGTIIAVLPEANVETRTLRVRVELPNPDGKLRPGMFARVMLDPGGAEPALYVASEAVIRTGTRNVVLVANDDGGYSPTTVEVGGEVNGKTRVLSGLQEGQKVVASGQFLIDSEASLKGVLARFGTQPQTTKHTAHQSDQASPSVHHGSGKVESISGSEIVISHGPIDSLDWPAMTMSFKLPRSDLASGVKVGDQVHFTFQPVGKEYVIEELMTHGSAS
ncbi:MAG: efflux RND transporter periplasmic adaptor subunit [Steroidobacteraceae bacterium]